MVAKKLIGLSLLLASASVASGSAFNLRGGRWLEDAQPAEAAAPAADPAGAQPTAAAAGTVKADWYDTKPGAAKPEISEDGKTITLTSKPGQEAMKVFSKEVSNGTSMFMDAEEANQMAHAYLLTS